jgi:hypothetical protein
VGVTVEVSVEVNVGVTEGVFVKVLVTVKVGVQKAPETAKLWTEPEPWMVPSSADKAIPTS